MVALGDVAFEVLDRVRALQAKQKEQAGSAWTD
jgi:hypothetical protein